MGGREFVSAVADRLSAKLRLRCLRKDDKGTTAVEFAMVAMPFLMLLFGIIAIGLYFFTIFTLENAVEQAARQLRTGQAQQAGMTAAQFRTLVCSYLPSHIPCDASIQVNVQNYPDSASITAASLPKCLNAAGALSGASNYIPGGANVIVLVWVCYEWKLAGKMPFLKLGKMGNGSALIQATTTFRTEPYSN